MTLAGSGAGGAILPDTLRREAQGSPLSREWVRPFGTMGAGLDGDWLSGVRQYRTVAIGSRPWEAVAISSGRGERQEPSKAMAAVEPGGVPDDTVKSDQRSVLALQGHEATWGSP